MSQAKPGREITAKDTTRKITNAFKADARQTTEHVAEAGEWISAKAQKAKRGTEDLLNG